MALLLPLFLLILTFFVGGAIVVLLFVCHRLGLSWRQVSPYLFGASVGFIIALVSTPDALPALEVYLGYLENMLSQIGLHKVVTVCHPFMATVGLFGVLVLTGITIGLFAVWVARKAA
jgi:hypothetical protein